MKTFRAYADEYRGVFHAFIEVRLHEARAEMLADIESMGYSTVNDQQGQCSGRAHYDKSGRLTGKFALMWLNADDVRANPAELVSHECVHAAMRHVRNRQADLSNIEGEEVLAYAQGCLMRQVNHRLHGLGVFA